MRLFKDGEVVPCTTTEIVKLYHLNVVSKLTHDTEFPVNT